MSESDSDLDPDNLTLNLAQDQEWQDVEEDVEDINFVSLFDDKKFTNIREMLQHCKNAHQFDIWKLRNDLQLDDLDLIKLINFTRSESKQQNEPLTITSKTQFHDDKYLKPVLQDDAVLYSLDDAFDDEPTTTDAVNPQAEIENLRRELSNLQHQFAAYRSDVQASLLQDLSQGSPKSSEPSTQTEPQSNLNHHRITPRGQQTATADQEYFDSYNYTSIHHIMLSDHIRTSAYRDFIYNNKHLFKDKIVLDVGCGTGILSLFAATAGARLVIAVDNSSIIEKAKENITANNLSNRIVCVRGKIEEITLPLPADAQEKVDIIISEWMGYALLYESMLDSVIYARDKYLSPNGLMVPSHASINISALGDSNLRVDYIDFWRDVYGFNFGNMLSGAFTDALIRTVLSKDVVGGVDDAARVVMYDLHKASVVDLSFTRPFELKWKEGYDRLEGWVVSFDIYFAGSRSQLDGMSSIQQAKEKGMTCFSTSPFTPTTHWEQVVLLIEDLRHGQKLNSKVTSRETQTSNTAHRDDTAINNEHPQPTDAEQKSGVREGWFASGPKLESDDTVRGVVKYEKHAERERSLTISVDWEVDKKIPRFGQTWQLD